LFQRLWNNIPEHLEKRSRAAGIMLQSSWSNIPEHLEGNYSIVDIT
jgi:hypothetical protein